MDGTLRGSKKTCTRKVPGRLTKLKMDLWKTIFLYKRVVFRFDVGLFQGIKGRPRGQLVTQLASESRPLWCSSRRQRGLVVRGGAGSNLHIYLRGGMRLGCVVFEALFVLVGCNVQNTICSDKSVVHVGWSSNRIPIYIRTLEKAGQRPALLQLVLVFTPLDMFQVIRGLSSSQPTSAPSRLGRRAPWEAQPTPRAFSIAKRCDTHGPPTLRPWRCLLGDGCQDQVSSEDPKACQAGSWCFLSPCGEPVRSMDKADEKPDGSCPGSFAQQGKVSGPKCLNNERCPFWKH